MKRFLCVLLSMSLLLFVFAGCSSSSTDTSVEGELTIAAAASLKNAMTDITTAFNEKYPNVTLTFDFGSSGDLQKKIENATGDEYDFFISAAQKQMNALEEEDLIVTDTREDFVENKLVLIEPADSDLVTDIDSLKNADVTTIALGEPSSVPAGQYAEEAFTNLGILSDVTAKAVYGKDVTQVLTYVEQGEAEAGVVYKTDAISTDKVKIVAEFPSDSYTAVIYPMAVLAQSTKQDQAKIFEEFLKSDDAKTILENYGFTPVE